MHNQVNLISLFVSQEGICWICGERIVNPYYLTADHVVPKSKGGKRGFYNMMPAHYLCNKYKTNASIIEAIKAINKLKTELGRDEFVKRVNNSHATIPKQIRESIRYRAFVSWYYEKYGTYSYCTKANVVETCADPPKETQLNLFGASQ